MALPPPGCVTLASFLPFVGLSVSICKMGRRAGRGGKSVAVDQLGLGEDTQTITISAVCRCESPSLPPGPFAGRWPLPLCSCQREMSSNKVSPLSFPVPIPATSVFR